MAFFCRGITIIDTLLKLILDTYVVSNALTRTEVSVTLILLVAGILLLCYSVKQHHRKRGFVVIKGPTREKLYKQLQRQYNELPRDTSCKKAVYIGTKEFTWKDHHDARKRILKAQLEELKTSMKKIHRHLLWINCQMYGSASAGLLLLGVALLRQL